MTVYQSNRTTNYGGTGFIGMLAITFIVLKLLGIITWSWFWVLSPIWISWALFIVIILIIAFFVKKY
jgi:hypothetical protein